MCWKVLIALLFVVMSSANAGLPAIKASSPVQITIQQESISVEGSQSTFVVFASSSIDAENFLVNVKLPAGVVLQTGELSWQGSVLAGEEKELRFTVLLQPDVEHTIVAEAKLVADEVTQFAATATYQNFTAFSSALKTDSKTNKSRTTSRRGRAITEYSLP